MFYVTLSLVFLSKVDDLLITSRGVVDLGRVENMLYDRINV